MKEDTRPLDTDFVRQQFPALTDNPVIFMDNAGGSQTLGLVIDRISEYLTHHDVQLGASYRTSARASTVLDAAVSDIADLVGVSRAEQIVLGPTSTMLLRILSLCLSENWQAGDEVIITDTDHEANVSCWLALENRGIRTRVWRVNQDSYRLETSDLQALLNDGTRLVSCCHVSNITGSIQQIREIAGVVHDAGALLAVDGVALAPHRAINFESLGADFYVFSGYKVFGPHIAVMAGRYDLLQQMSGINHRMIDSVPYKFQPGSFNYELGYGFAGVRHYLDAFCDHHHTTAIPTADDTVQQAFKIIADHEAELTAPLLDFLDARPGVRVIGDRSADPDSRVSTVSFIHEDQDSPSIVRQMDRHDIGIRHGDFYATELIKALGLRNKGGVVRASLCHYNTSDEVDRLIDGLSRIL